MPRALHQLARTPREKRELIEATSAIPRVRGFRERRGQVDCLNQPKLARAAPLNFVRDSAHVIPYDYNANNRPFGSTILLNLTTGEDSIGPPSSFTNIRPAHVLSCRPFATPNRESQVFTTELFERLQRNRHFRAIRNIWSPS